MAYQCPHCGQTESFLVLRSVWGVVDGKENMTEEVFEDLGWDYVRCPKCDYAADYREFEVI